MKCVGYFLHSSCSQSILNNWPIVLLMVFGSFSFVPPPQYVMRPPFKEHVSLHAKSLCKNMACASGGGGHKRKRSRFSCANDRKVLLSNL